jgi:hypothetical protein
MNQWHELRNFINSKPKLQIFTRKEMVRAVHGSVNNFPYLPKYELTIDHYRRFLTVIGYISHVGRGLYMVVKPIPEGMSRRYLETLYSSELRRIRNERSRRNNSI